MPSPDRPAVYLASPLGFCDAGRLLYSTRLLPAVEAAGLAGLDPWAGPGGEAVAAAAALEDRDARLGALRAANRAIGARNHGLMERAVAALAVLDGVAVDSGTASEVGYCFARGIPVVGWRSDFRLAGDNEAAVVNIQLEYFIEASGGAIHRHLEAAVSQLAALVGARLSA